MTNEEWVLLEKFRTKIEDRFIHVDDPRDSDYCFKCEMLTIVEELQNA